MSFARIGRLALVAITIFGILIFLVGRWVGPALRDVSFEIANGYRYFDAGHYEKSIDYRGSERKSGTVIDARVDDFTVKDGRLLVARRPRVAVLADDDTLRTHLLPTCEYWIINLKTHAVEQVPELERVRCH